MIFVSNRRSVTLGVLSIVIIARTGYLLDWLPPGLASSWTGYLLMSMSHDRVIQQIGKMTLTSLLTRPFDTSIRF